MRRGFKDALTEHIRHQCGLYLFILLIFTLGVAAGSLSLRWLAETETREITDYFMRFIRSLRLGEPFNPLPALRRSLLQNGVFAAFLWFCGNFFLGFLPALGLIFYRGFTIGFTVGFLAEEKAVNGVLFAISSVLPQNLLYVPLTVVCGVLSVSLSLELFRRRLNRKKVPYGSYLLHYSAVMIIAAVLFAAGSLVETLITPVFMRAAASLL